MPDTLTTAADSPESFTADTPAQRTASHWITLGMILVGAAVLFIYRLDAQSLWVDELAAMETSTGRGLAHAWLPKGQIIEHPVVLTSLKDAPPWWTVWTSMGTDAHPPLHSILLRLWREAFGESDLAARSLSVVLMLIAVVLLYAVAYELHGAAPALWASAIMTMAVPTIQYAQEVRSYVLLLMLGILCCWLLIRVEKHGPSTTRLAGLTAALLGFMLTHYFAAGAITGLGLYVLIRFRGSVLWKTIGAFAAAGVLFLIVWGPFFWEQRRVFSGTNIVLADHPTNHIQRTIDRLLSLPMEFLGEPPKTVTGFAKVAALIYALPLFLWKRRPDLTIWFFWLLGTVGMLAALDLTRTTKHLTFMRYLLLSSPAFYLIVSALLAHHRGWLRHAVPAVAALSCLLALPRAYTMYPIPKGNWREAAHRFEQYRQPGELACFAEIPTELSYTDENFSGLIYMAIAHNLKTPVGPIVLLNKPATAEVISRASQTGECWLLTGTPYTPISEILPGAEPDMDRSLGIPGWAHMNRVSFKAKPQADP